MTRQHAKQILDANASVNAFQWWHALNKLLLIFWKDQLCPNTNRYTSNNIKDSYPLPSLLEHFLVWAVTVVPTLFLETTVASSRSLLPSTTMLLILGSEAPNLRLSGEVLGGIIVADLCSVGDRHWSLRNTFLGLRLLWWFSDKREDTSEST
jgi:hypothetical protein